MKHIIKQPKQDSEYQALLEKLKEMIVYDYTVTTISDYFTDTSYV